MIRLAFLERLTVPGVQGQSGGGGGEGTGGKATRSETLVRNEVSTPGERR